MVIAHELGKFESEVLQLLPHELARWVAYFEIKYEREKEASRQATARAKSRAKIRR